MDEEEAQIVRLHVKGLGANLSALVERNKAIERENRSLRARVSELEAVQVVATTPLREHVATQTDFSLIQESSPSSSRRSPTTLIPSDPPTPPPSPSRANSPVSDRSPVPIQEPVQEPVQEASMTVVVQPVPQQQVEVAVTAVQISNPEEGNTNEMRNLPEQRLKPIDEGSNLEMDLINHPIHSLHAPVGLAEALHMNPDPATAVAMGTVSLVCPEEENEECNEGNTSDHAVSRPAMLPSLWHVLARRGRLPSRPRLCNRIVRRTPATPSDGGRGLGFLIGDVIVRDPS